MLPVITMSPLRGLTELQMNKEHDFGGVREHQFRVFERLGLFDIKPAKGKTGSTRGQREPVASSLLPKPPEQYRKLVDPYDRTQEIDLRARSYLHSNCAQCHVEAGGGNSQMELEFTTPVGKMRLIDVKPVHDSYGIEDARLVAPGHPERSILLQRIAHRDRGHMPPLATRVVDRDAVELMGEWIRRMKE